VKSVDSTVGPGLTAVGGTAVIARPLTTPVVLMSFALRFWDRTVVQSRTVIDLGTSYP
jgi:hypothetical protein